MLHVTDIAAALQLPVSLVCFRPNTSRRQQTQYLETNPEPANK
jgi:hypothetical protein